jgi:hypothetical protein
VAQFRWQIFISSLPFNLSQAGFWPKAYSPGRGLRAYGSLTSRDCTGFYQGVPHLLENGATGRGDRGAGVLPARGPADDKPFWPKTLAAGRVLLAVHGCVDICARRSHVAGHGVVHETGTGECGISHRQPPRVRRSWEDQVP